MKEKELKQISINNQKLLKLKNQYEDLRWKSLAKGQVITGMPHCSGSKDSIGDYISDMDMVEQDIKTLSEVNNLLVFKARRFIDNIPDAIIRMIFELKYINGIPDYSIPGLVGQRLKEKDVKKIIRTFFLDSLLYM